MKQDQPNRICKECGHPIPADTRNNWCGPCLMKLGLEAGEDDALDDELDSEQTEHTATASEPGSLSKMLGDVAESLGKAARTLVASDYELLEVIGHGGMGMVYKARQISLNRLVALKMIRSGALATKEETQRFLNEAQAVASLEHPNIVALHAVGKNDGGYFLSMQLIHGADLAKVIQAREDSGQIPALPCRQAVEIMIKVARAVLHAHQRRILHRDLKPSNILLDEQGEPHVVDFGVAKRIGVPTGMTPQGSPIGTPGYMSPEQAQGRNDELTTLTDVYGLGAVLYFLLTGLPPIQGKSDLETLQMVVDKEPVRPGLRNPKVNRDLETICLKCLRKDPNSRYVSAEVLAEDLERWLDGRPIRGRRVSLVERSIRLMRRNPALACTVAAVVALTFGIIALLIMFAGREFEANEIIRKNLAADLKRLWENTNEVSCPIRSNVRRAFTGSQTFNGKAAETALVFAVYTHQKPEKMLEGFSPILDLIEESLDRQIDLEIFKGYSHAIDALVSGEVDFMRPGPAAYVEARRKDTNLILLAKQLHSGTNVMRGVFFTRAHSPINSLRDLRLYPGLKTNWFAFGDESSTFGSVMARVVLVEAGIYATNFADHRHSKSHDETVWVVATNSIYIAGAANAGVVSNLISRDVKVKIIEPSMQSVTFPWVASSHLDTNVAAVIKQTLLQLKDHKILGKIDDGSVTGFTNASPAEFEEMERQLPKAEQFEIERRSSPR